MSNMINVACDLEHNYILQMLIGTLLNVNLAKLVNGHSSST